MQTRGPALSAAGAELAPADVGGDLEALRSKLAPAEP